MTEISRLDRLLLAAGKKSAEKAYWLAKLAGDWQRASFPSLYEANGTGEAVAANVSFKLGEDLSSGLMRLCAGSDIRLHILLTALVTLLLSKYTGQDDIILGTPILKSAKGGEEELINTVLPVRNRVSGAESFKEFLMRVKQNLIEADRYRNYPIEILQLLLGLPVFGDTSPLFDVALLLENIHDREYLSHVSPGIIFSFMRQERGIEAGVEYRSPSYHPENIERIMGRFCHLVGQIVADPEAKVYDIELLLPEEREKLLVDFNGTTREYPTDKTIYQLFSERVEKFPDRIALVGTLHGAWDVESRGFQNVQLNYRELNDQSHRLAGMLMQRGVTANTVAAVMMHRSLEMVGAIFAILNAGAAYLPIDPEYPQERVEYILKDSGAAILLTTEHTEGTEKKSYEKVSLCSVFSISHAPCSMLHAISSENLAYIIYTSGSTGKPKGVPVNHSSIVNTLCALQENYPLQASDTYLLKTSFLFDVSVGELFGWFWEGGRLAVLAKGGERDPQQIAASIERYRVTHINFVPSMFNLFVEGLDNEKIDKLSSLKYIFLAGEALPPEMVAKFARKKSGIRLENIYGPTEAAIYGSWYAIENGRDARRIPIGKPLWNVGLYILDKYGRMQPVGVFGELHIAGPGVARGYLNRPELTAERFITAPAHSLQPQPGGVGAQNVVPLQSLMAEHGRPRGVAPTNCKLTTENCKLYKTGDLCRWLPCGNVEFLGRIDHQVKVRGFRIELGEVESRLLKHPAVNEAVVVCRQDNGREKYLCAYIVARGMEHGARDVGAAPRGRPPGGNERRSPAAGVGAQDVVPLQEGISIADLREFLSRGLPDYMVPSCVEVLDEMPLTATGKVDRLALPEPGRSRHRLEKTYAAPGTDLEKAVADIWAEVLHLDRVGVEDNFFDLGGTSLDIIRVGSKLNDLVQKEIPSAHLFTYPTIRSLAGYLDRQESRESPAEEKAKQSQRLDKSRDKKKRAAMMRRNRQHV